MPLGQGLMSERAYRALLIGNASYQGLPELNGPAVDVAELHKALLDPETGLHSEGQFVGPLVDLTADQMRREIAMFFGSGQEGEQLLFYFSGHGERSFGNDLWLCGTNTIIGRDDQLIATALEAATIAKLMRNSNATAKVIILDCCYSGGFFKGDGDLPYHLRGAGCFGLFSTHGHVRAEDVAKSGTPSPFTGALIDALRSTAVDRDDDGFADIDDIYLSVLDRLRQADRPVPTRSMSGSTVGTVALARRRRGVRAPVTGPEPPRWPEWVILPTGPPPMVPVPPKEPRFRMAQALVTNRQYAQFLAEPENRQWRLGELPVPGYLAHWQGNGFAVLSEHPVVNVTPLAAEAYTRWVTRRWGRELRLPRADEWETAARAGRARDDFASADADFGRVNFRGSEGRLSATGVFPLNDYGVADLVGNAYDLCLAPGSASAAEGVIGCGGTFRTPRHLLDRPRRVDPGECRSDLGFRCVQPIPEGGCPDE
jgi:Sulfatase-modifying factor enzyme 1/Caspase domain